MAYFADDSEPMQLLEKMVDTVGTRNVAYAVARICELKAQHLEEAWQDKAAAKQWDKCAHAWRAVAGKCPTSPLD